MCDYRLEYIWLTYILFMYDEDEGWERIIIDSEFEFHSAIKILKEKLEDIVERKSKENSYEKKEGLEFYSNILKQVRRIYA